MRALRVPLATGAALAAVALAGVSPAIAASDPPREAVVTLHRGVRTIGDLRVGPFGAAAAPTLADVRAAWGPERRLKRIAAEACIASWGTGVRLTFTTFGARVPCAQRPLQGADVLGGRWSVKVGERRYAVGAPRSSLPADAQRIPRYGFQLASMPFVGTHTTTVAAHVADGRIDRFWLFIGGAGD
jgi:hypothetical protein